jgi:hypothetical protein
MHTSASRTPSPLFCSRREHHDDPSVTLYELWWHCTYPWRRRRLERELREEMSLHVELRTEQFRRRGLDASDATRAARRRLGTQRVSRMRRVLRGTVAGDGSTALARTCAMSSANFGEASGSRPSRC